MKRITVVLSLILIILAGCSDEAENDSKELESNVEEERREEITQDLLKQLIVDRSTFHFVVDWLTNEEILFVEKSKETYLLKSFNVYTEEMKTIYEEDMIIADVFIHPTEDLLLLHTTANAMSATVKIITLDGIVQNEVTVESSELEIEWNDLNPYFILLTAFHQDWTFDVFMFNGLENQLELLSLENPFPKWLGADEYVVTDLSDHSLDGGKLHKYNQVTGQKVGFNADHIIFYDTFKDALLYMQIDEDEQAVFTIIDKEETELAHWTMPAISNYSEWVIPTIDWIAENSVVISRTHKNSQLDEIEEPFELVQVIGDEQKVIISEADNPSVRCSPDAKKCLTGSTFEQLIDVTNDEEKQWLLFMDE